MASPHHLHTQSTHRRVHEKVGFSPQTISLLIQIGPPRFAASFTMYIAALATLFVSAFVYFFTKLYAARMFIIERKRMGLVSSLYSSQKHVTYLVKASSS